MPKCVSWNKSDFLRVSWIFSDWCHFCSPIFSFLMIFWFKWDTTLLRTTINCDEFKTNGLQEGQWYATILPPRHDVCDSFCHFSFPFNGNRRCWSRLRTRKAMRVQRLVITLEIDRGSSSARSGTHPLSRTKYCWLGSSQNGVKLFERTKQPKNITNKNPNANLQFGFFCGDHNPASASTHTHTHTHNDSGKKSIAQTWNSFSVGLPFHGNGTKTNFTAVGPLLLRQVFSNFNVLCWIILFFQGCKAFCAIYFSKFNWKQVMLVCEQNLFDKSVGTFFVQNCFCLGVLWR